MSNTPIENIIELKDKRSNLLTEVSKLESSLEELNAKVANHAALTLSFEKLTADTEAKQKEAEIATKELRAIVIEKTQKEKEIAEIEALKKEKTAISEEVSKLQAVLRVVQQEIASFRAGKEQVIKQLQAQTDVEQYKLFKIEESKKSALDAMQAAIEAHK